MSRHRWVAPALLLLGVVLMGSGITGMLRAAYIQHPSWALVILPPGEMLIGCLFLLIPLLRRLSQESAAQEEADRKAFPQGGPPPSR
jgi:hypothetical protein